MGPQVTVCTSDAAALASQQVDQVVTATRVVGALIAESLAGFDTPLPMPQWRVMVLTSEAECNVSAIAEDLGVHMSNATRTCDRLVASDLLERRRALHDKRHVILAHAPAGRALFERAMDHRRRRVEQAMALMHPDARAALAEALSDFVEAAREVRARRPVS